MPSKRNSKTITGDGSRVNCNAMNVRTTATRLNQLKGAEIETKSRKVAANIIPTTTAFIPSIALKTIT